MSDGSVIRIVLAAFGLALAFTPVSIFLARRWNLMDLPGNEAHKTHKKPMPIAGGLVLFITLMLTPALFGGWETPSTTWLQLGFTVMFIVGLIDDRINLPPLLKLLGQLTATALIMASGVQVRLFYNEAINTALTVFWLVGITNAMNLVDSMDGLMVGLGMLTAGFFLLATVNSGQVTLSLLSAVLLGACVALYYFNAAPARAFMGDSGSQLLGLTLATIGLAYTPLGYSRLASWYVPIMLLALPVFDTSLVVFSRLRRGLPIYHANLDHSYHRLVKMGLSSNRAILTIHSAAFLLNCLAFVALNSNVVAANIIFGGMVVLGWLVIFLLDRREFWDAPGPATNPIKQTANLE